MLWSQNIESSKIDDARWILLTFGIDIKAGTSQGEGYFLGVPVHPFGAPIPNAELEAFQIGI